MDGECVCEDNCQNNVAEPLCANGMCQITNWLTLLGGEGTRSIPIMLLFWSFFHKILKQWQTLFSFCFHFFCEKLNAFIFCDLDGNTYRNECEMNRMACNNKMELIAWVFIDFLVIKYYTHTHTPVASLQNML